MVLSLRLVGEDETTSDVYVKPALEIFADNPGKTLAAFSHQTMAIMMNELTQLMTHATDLYNNLYVELNDTAQRVSDLAIRVQAAADFMPALEDYVQYAGPEAFINRLGAQYNTEKYENAQLMRPDLRTKPLRMLYLQSKPPPNLSIMDKYRAPEEGPSSLREYTNPNFFVEEWLREQLAKAKEAKNRRRQRGADRKSRGGLRKDQAVAEVGKMKKTRYNKWGEKLEDGEEDDAPSTASRKPSVTAAQTTSTAALPAPSVKPESPRQKAPAPNKQRVAPGVGTNPLALDSPLSLTPRDKASSHGGLEGSRITGSRVSPRPSSPKATPTTDGSSAPSTRKGGSSISRASSLSQSRPSLSSRTSSLADPVEAPPVLPDRNSSAVTPPDLKTSGGPVITPKEDTQPRKPSAEESNPPVAVRAVVPSGARPARGFLGGASHRNTLNSKPDIDFVALAASAGPSSQSDTTPKAEPSPKQPSSESLGASGKSKDPSPSCSAEPLDSTAASATVATTAPKKKKKKTKRDKGEKSEKKSAKKKGSKRRKHSSIKQPVHSSKEALSSVPAPVPAPVSVPVVPALVAPTAPKVAPAPPKPAAPAPPPPAAVAYQPPPPPSPAPPSAAPPPPASPRSGHGGGGLTPRARTSPRPTAVAAPSPPPPPMKIPDAPEEKRSGLLQQIQAGAQLRRVQQQEKNRAPRETHDDGSINVAAILQRRIALEYSDSESDGDGSDDSDWD
eukprot:TRINITY_DN2660_c1_g1_i1.p1 TRINITY_DN2660_c1_g1~~TRINITY_DN2660_c1_g1_i1.p1  ORF type:complete len:730 (+),score=133.48 TRINITY_DN2660_c1_g1_i1:81-2270(+)